MNDIHAELAALPPFSSPVAYRDTWQAGCEIAVQDVIALRARLAIAERLLDTTMAELSPPLYLAACEEARAYLAFRAKEQQT